MRIPGRRDRLDGDQFVVAREDATRLEQETGAVLERAVGAQWYERGTDVDRAAFDLCRLRRSAAAIGGGIEHGDEAVRRVLEAASPQALTWIASRAISYMDENGYVDAVSTWFPLDDDGS